jgi:hypothetical protein
MEKIQELYERIYGSINGDNITEEYQLLLDTLLMFSNETRQNLNIQEIKNDFLWHISMNDLNLNFAYKFSKELNLKLENEISTIIQNNGNIKTITSYIGLNQLEDEEIVKLAVLGIKKILPEKQEDIEIAKCLKEYLEEKDLYEKTISQIKQSGDPETIVAAALCFEPKLIKEIFGSKKDMYLYLCANTFSDDEDIEYYKDRLLNMENNGLKRQLTKQATKLNEKIKQKKLGE